MSVIIISENDRLFNLLVQSKDFSEGDIKNYSTAAQILEDVSDKIIIYETNTEVLQGAYRSIFIGINGKQGDTDSFYMKKPIKLASLMAIISGFISEVKKNTVTHDINGCRFSYLHKEIEVNGKIISLTEKEAEIINMLNKAWPEAMDKYELLSKVWGYEKEIDTNTLETHIYRLRRKIMPSGDFILSEKDGYKINKTT